MNKHIHLKTPDEIDKKYKPVPELSSPGVAFHVGGWGPEYIVQLLYGLHHRLARIEEKLNEVKDG